MESISRITTNNKFSPSIRRFSRNPLTRNCLRNHSCFFRYRKLGTGIISAVQTGKELRQKRPQNVDGEFYVDHTCIDCDACRWMAPKTFSRVAGRSAVYKQPSSKEERLEALQALLSCPTSSIHTEIPPHDIKEVQMTFPIPINEQRIPGVYHCGYHSEKSFGAASYFIVHPEGNILVDSPRYTETLERNLELLGGVRFMFLTHKDDIADHEKWSNRFNCERILHSTEVQASTAGVERKLEGTGPWSLYPDIELVHTPGHTEMARENMVDGLPRLQLKLFNAWEGCLLGKQTRSKFQQHSDFQAGSLFGLVYSDVCGPFQVPSLGGSHYFLLFVDVYSRKTWIFFLKHKSEVFSKFKVFLALAERTSGKQLGTLQSDKDGETFTSTAFVEFCQTQGIRKVVTVPYTPQLNGVVETRNQTILNMGPIVTLYHLKLSM